MERGSCSLGNGCTQRHPQRCKYWSRGYYWRGSTCLYLHFKEDFGREKKETRQEITDREENEKGDQNLESEDKGGEIVSVKDKELTTTVDKHVVDDETVDKNHEFEVKTDENFSGLSTDEILALYENVEINEEDLITVEEIMKIYET